MEIKGTTMRIEAAVLLFMSTLALSASQGRVTFDPNAITDPDKLSALEDYLMVSLLEVPSTSTFKLIMNDKAMKGMPHLVDSTNQPENQINNRLGRSSSSHHIIPEQNVSQLETSSSTEVSMFESANATDLNGHHLESSNSIFLKDPHDFSSSKSNTTVEEDVQEIVKLVNDPTVIGAIVMVLTEENFDHIMSVLYTFRNLRSRNFVPNPEVELLDWNSWGERVQEVLANVTQGENVDESGRAFFSAGSPMHVAEEHLQRMMTSVFSMTRNDGVSQENKTAAQLYITKKFDAFGLMVVHHIFSSDEYRLWFERDVEGTNVIGILPGELWGTPFDAPVVLGAHLDTVEATPGLDDNGSGLAALVEVARVLSSSACKYRHSIYFVAFDLEEIGTQGSVMFIKDFLITSVMKHFGMTRVTAAIVLDCIANWDPTPHSQDFPDSWETFFPDVSRKMYESNHTGDFTAVLYRTQVDSKVALTFARYYESLGHQKYGLKLMGLNELASTMPTLKQVKSHYDFLRSDHTRFWYLNDTLYNETVPTILISDLGPFRGIMRTCYHRFCDSIEAGLGDVGLVAKVTQALVWTVSDLAQARCGPRLKLSTQQLFAFVGKTERRKPTDGIAMETVQMALELLHFLDIIPSENRSPSDMNLK